MNALIINKPVICSCTSFRAAVIGQDSFFSGRKTLGTLQNAQHFTKKALPCCKPALFLCQQYLDNISPVIAVWLVAWKGATVTTLASWSKVQRFWTSSKQQHPKSRAHWKKDGCSTFPLGSCMCPLLIGNNRKNIRKKTYRHQSIVWLWFNVAFKSKCMRLQILP